MASLWKCQRGSRDTSDFTEEKEEEGGKNAKRIMIVGLQSSVIMEMKFAFACPVDRRPAGGRWPQISQVFK